MKTNKVRNRAFLGKKHNINEQCNLPILFVGISWQNWPQIQIARKSQIKSQRHRFLCYVRTASDTLCIIFAKGWKVGLLPIDLITEPITIGRTAWRKMNLSITVR